MHIFNNDMKLFQKSLKFSNTMTWTKFTSDKCDLNNRALKTFLIQVIFFFSELNWIELTIYTRLWITFFSLENGTARENLKLFQMNCYSEIKDLTEMKFQIF